MKRLLTIATVVGALACHTAQAQETGIDDSLQGTADQAAQSTSDTAQAIDEAKSDAANQRSPQNDDSSIRSQDFEARTQAQTDADLGDPQQDTQLDAQLRDQSDARNNQNQFELDADASANVRGDQPQTDAELRSDADANPYLRSPSDQQAQSNLDSRSNVRGMNFAPSIPFQARTQASDSRDAQWRFAQRNGEWWYYSPENQWMYYRDNQWQTFDPNAFQPLANNNAMRQQQGSMSQQQDYRSGYRGPMDSTAGSSAVVNPGQSYVLRRDAWGREFICVNGRPVYFDNQQGQTHQQQQGQTYQQQGQTNQQGTQNRNNQGTQNRNNQGTQGGQSNQGATSGSLNSNTRGSVESPAGNANIGADANVDIGNQ